MSYNLFLDDIRQPHEAYEYTQAEIFLKWDWVVVKNYTQFIKYIEEHGLPNFVSFDHDLHPEHYTPEEYWDNYERSKEYQEAQTYLEPTGEECAHWLIKYCQKKDVKLPEYFCHSQNPVGKDWIIKPLEKYKKEKAYEIDSGLCNL